MMGRSPCCDDSGMKKGPWTPEEDRKLVEYIQRHGHGKLEALPKLAGLNRYGKSCRLRWTNYLRPDIKRGKFSEEEEQAIINLHSVLGNKWSAIAGHLCGRTDNEIKNFWNTHLRKKLLQRGIDPETHGPRTDLQAFANWPQLLATAANLSSLLIHPFDSVLRLQAEATHLAKIHLLQNIFQVLSTNPAQNAGLSSLLGAGSMPFQDHQLLDYLTNFSCQADGQAYTDQLPGNYACFESPQTLQNGDLHQHVAASGGRHNHSIDQFGSASTAVPALSFNEMPPLALYSPEKSSFDQRECKSNPVENSATTTFEDWNTLLDDEASHSFWGNIID
ncbi:hypothetical protein Nepgr_020322 [Nepenthes gracilis]|uniref:Uncharacterized protein n=1 Tax=Nepenthes gracilis TaxID=150966 RepID=A0AAD3XW90_NEPGR|nr:hypothetical protein Nepgr_020322 [Nepenthes gracilis]